MTAKMQPFYVLVSNQTGERIETCSSSVLSDFMPFWDQYIRAGTHRIEHIRDQSGLVEELRTLSEDLRNKTNAFGRGFDQSEDAAYDRAADRIDAILSKYGEK